MKHIHHIQHAKVSLGCDVNKIERSRARLIRPFPFLYQAAHQLKYAGMLTPK